MSKELARRCLYDDCHPLPKSSPFNAKYCHRAGCKCYRKAQNDCKRKPSEEVTCEYDGCHKFVVEGSMRRRYCPECGCSKKAKKKNDGQHRYGTLNAQAQLFEQPQEYAVLQIRRLPEATKVMITGDMHVPFQDHPTVEAVEKFWDDFAPDLEIYNGDISDFYGISEFNQNPTRLFSLQEELDEARGFLHRRAERNPNARRIFGDGNHEDRLRRWLWRHGPELQSLRALALEELLGLKEMKFKHVNYRSVIDLLGFRVEHGYRASKSAAFPMNVARLMAIATGSSGYCGHTHRFNHYGWSDSRGTHSYIEGGCLCLLQLEYAPFPNWQHSFTYGIVHNNRLHIIPVRIYPDGFRAEGEFYPRV